MVWKHTVTAKSFVLTFHLLKCSVTQQFFVLHLKDVVHS
ncbi:Uncharacterised protein [Mycobacterium tuberculosis]|nr:Uncharacterised protein [Mycobacterium tuberculosis]CKU24616.1 Uncharacterised protein [Mycobacterium tuberculosis]